MVAHVIGGDAALTVLQRMHDAGWERTAAMLVRPIEPTVVAHGQENSESVTDLPDRRIVVAGAFGAVIGAIATAALGWLIADEFATVAVAAGMGAFFGAVIGVMLGGLGRYAGEQAWSQPHAPGRTMGVVAVFISDEESLVEAVRELEVATPDVIRIVNASGAWRAPIA